MPEAKLTQKVKVDVLSDPERARQVERLRAGDAPIAPPDVRAVIIGGVTYVVPTGRGVSVPAGVAEVLEQAERPLRTAQMRHGGAPLIDLRDE